jgi:hypothetical protein
MKQELEKVKDDGTAEVVVESKEENKEEPIEIEPKGSLVGKNKEEVDAVVEKEESKTESENDEESDDLSSYSTNVQKRIQKLTFEKKRSRTNSKRRCRTC